MYLEGKLNKTDTLGIFRMVFSSCKTTVSTNEGDYGHVS